MNTLETGNGGANLAVYLVTALTGFVVNNWSTIFFVAFGAVHCFIAIRNHLAVSKERKYREGQQGKDHAT